MLTLTLVRNRIACAGLCLCLWTGVTTRAADAGASAATPEFDAPESTFLDDYQNGKDPFFPMSERRKPKAVVPIIDDSRVPTVTDLILRGISGTADRRVALINHRTFEVGEEGAVRISGRTNSMTITCVEIRETTVVITLAGHPERHELQLEDQALPIGGERE